MAKEKKVDFVVTTVEREEMDGGNAAVVVQQVDTGTLPDE